MSNEYNLGVLNAKISALLTESDFTVFDSLSEGDKLAFFIDHNLVSTNIVSNFEAMCAYVLRDLKAEVAEYLGSEHFYLAYFFKNGASKETTAATVERFNKVYEQAIKKNDVWFLYYLDLQHAILNLLTILRATNLGKSRAEIESYYLVQKFINGDTFKALVNGERSDVFAYIKSNFNLELEVGATNSVISAKLDAYLYGKLKEFAYEPDFAPTLIYYIKMKEYEVLRLRSIYYTKENGQWMS